MTRDVIKLLRSGDKRTIAQLISIVENGVSTPVLKRIFPYTGNAYQVGITGPPGAGKSTLVNAIAREMLEQNKKVGIIAVDPTSPFSGGALLGDRVRMSDLALHENVFIRSMASRGSLGGLAFKTKDALLVLDAAGMDYSLVETIGVGQVELDIAEVCDTTIVVLVPESGDSIQAMKAGLIEIADILVVNKSDRQGSDRLLTELKFALEMREQRNGWYYPILQTVAIEHTGIKELAGVIHQHQQYLQNGGILENLRKEKLKIRIHELIEDRIRDRVRSIIAHTEDVSAMLDLVYRRKKDPYSIAQRVASMILKGRR